MKRETAELIVKVYAVLAWLGALLTLIGAVALLGLGAMGGVGTAMAGITPEELAAGGLFTGFAIIMAVILLVLAVFYAIVGWGLWTRKGWARIATIVMSVLSLFSFPVGTIIGALGIWLFGFEETVKSLFTGSARSTPMKTVKVKKAAKKKR